MRSQPVYLDTARMGKISPTAMAIQLDYLRFASERSCCKSIQDLLIQGGQAWPARLQRRYPVLASWAGVGSLKQRLCDIAGAESHTQGIIANRSHTMMHLAAHLLLRNCETVLTTDLAWPAYRDVLTRVAHQLGRRIVEIPLRKAAFTRSDSESLIDHIGQVFKKCGATGLFLSAISHDGVRLPMAEIAQAVQRSSELRFFAVDGAQHLAHGDCPLTAMNCDFYLAGTHKWLRSLYPLGVGLYGQSRSSAMVETTVRELTAIGILDDPLLQLTGQLESHTLNTPMETVNLSALLSAHGATRDSFPASRRGQSAAIQSSNAEHICSMATAAGWRPLRLPFGLRSGIVMIRPPRGWSCDRGNLGNHLAVRGVIATTYDKGAVRLSMPRRPLASRQLEVLQRSFSAMPIAR